MTFLLQLNRSMFPSKSPDGTTVQAWPLNTDAVEFSAPVRQLQLLLSRLETILDEAPPDTGPRRFGNVSFRKWFQIVESRADELLDECLAAEVLEQKVAEGATMTTAKAELKAYLLGSWGSAQRLDYGTGHELSFLAFLAGVWKLNGFPKADLGVEERSIVLGVIQPYVLAFQWYRDHMGVCANKYQIPRAHQNHHQTLHPRTRRFARRLGSRRPLLHPLYIRRSPICSSDVRIRPRPGRGLASRRSGAGRCRQSQHRRERTPDQHVFLRGGLYLRC